MEVRRPRFEVRHLGKSFLTNVTSTDVPTGSGWVSLTCGKEGNQDKDLATLLWLWLIVSKWDL